MCGDIVLFFFSNSFCGCYWPGSSVPMALILVEFLGNDSNRCMNALICF